MESRQVFSATNPELNTSNSSLSDWNALEKAFTQAVNTYGYKAASEEKQPCFSL